MNAEVDEINWEDLRAAAGLYDTLNLKQSNMFTKPESGEINGTSFFSDEVIATVDELTKVLGPADYDDNDGADKINFQWARKTLDGVVFTIYDWKHYRSLDRDEHICWHIGAHGADQSKKVWSAVVKALNAR